MSYWLFILAVVMGIDVTYTLIYTFTMPGPVGSQLSNHKQTIRWFLTFYVPFYTNNEISFKMEPNRIWYWRNYWCKSFKAVHSFTNLIVSSEISAFLFFLPKKIVNNKVSYRKIMRLVNYITTYSFTPQICSAYLTMGL